MQQDLFNTLANALRPATPGEIATIMQPAGKMFDQSPTAIPSHQNRQDMLALIYSNGGNNPATIRFHEDGGHGWLQVPHSLLKRLQIAGKISGYSYRDVNFGYLEEDCDLSVFLNSLGIVAGSELNKLFWSMCPQEYNENTPIRNKKHY